MYRFWDILTLPLLEAVNAKSIIEIGAFQGENTRLLLDYCETADAQLNVIEPMPLFDLSDFPAKNREKLHLIKEPSLDALPKISAANVVIVDGDHNWYTVYNELRLIHQQCSSQSGHKPVILLHDIGWPYGRRDLYYDPDTIPEQYRQPYARGGILRGQSDLVKGQGLNAGLRHAVHEGGPRNGVRTAVEDFMAEHANEYELHEIPSLFGYGILVPVRTLAQESTLQDFLSQLKCSSLIKQLQQLAEREYNQMWIRLQAATRALDAEKARSEKKAHKLRLSVVVVIFDMTREAPRTLHSLCSEYQQGINEEDYEVIVVENGSLQPLPESAIQALPANFRYISMAPASPSPVPAINKGLAMARGEIIGVFIDGARMATPGLLQWALKAAKLSTRPIINSLNWLLGLKLQSISMLEGYDQTVEDKLLKSIDWPNDGYRLFEIGVLAGSSGGGWFAPSMESNALFMTRAMWDELGGYDEAFDLPGGGFANPDTYRRACELPESELVVLLGEGTFHQFHGGIAVNCSLEELANKMKPWLEQYQQLRGYPWALPTKQSILLGKLPSQVDRHKARLAGIRGAA